MRNTPAEQGEGVGNQLDGCPDPSTTPEPTRQAKWAAAHPQARWAHDALRSAIRRGLIAPEPCAECGAEKVDGHHDDYDKPMAVRWLCRRHHRAMHKDGR